MFPVTAYEPDVTCALEREGFHIVRSVIPAVWVNRLTKASGTSGKPGTRNLLRDEPAVAEVVRQPWIGALIVPIQGLEARCVRALFFDKNEMANWGVAGASSHCPRA